MLIYEKKFWDDRYTNNEYVYGTNPKAIQWETHNESKVILQQKCFDSKKQGEPLLQIHGGRELIQILQSKEQIGEYRLWVFLLIVGPVKC